MAPRQRDPDGPPLPSIDSLDDTGEAGELQRGDLTEPATFSLHPPKPSAARSLPPPTLTAVHRPSRPIAVPLDTTALPPVPAALIGSTGVPSPSLGHPLFSIVAFAIMIGATTTPLLRYFGVFQEALPFAQAQMSTQRAQQAQVDATAKPIAGPAALAAQVKTTPHDSRIAQLAELERLVPKEPAAATAWLLNAADERRVDGDVALAELLLARALEHDEDSPELAFSFAQVRKAQGNLEGAEGWLLKAMRLKPREAAYHEFYAELLRSLGRTREAGRAARQAQALRR